MLEKILFLQLKHILTEKNEFFFQFLSFFISFIEKS